MSKDYDQISRDKIRNDIHSNFFVEAGAGSGKTSVLVDRMAAMVEGGIDISRICAITFTKAAAGEFYARFQQKLSESDSENAKKALKDIDLCFMGTIDSFCNMVLSEHPAAAGIPSNAVVVEKEEMDALYLREYSRILRGEAGDELRRKAERFSGCFYNAGEIFLKGMNVLSASKNAHFNYVAPGSDEPDEQFKTEKARLVSVLRYLHDHPEIAATEKNKKAAEAYDALDDSIDTIEGSWNDDLGNVERALRSLKDLRVIPECDMNLFGPGWEDFFAPHYTRSKITWYEIESEKDPLMVEAIKNLRFSIAADFINDCLDDISDTLRKEGKLSFSDYLLYLRDLLKKDAKEGGKLIKHIYGRHSYFLIDEYQDTNPIQTEVFFYLTAKEPKENWKECIPHSGSLFIVGDPKQSIYRFRNADVASFIGVRELFRNPDVGEVLMLYRNFRSTDKMCMWFNRAFTSLLPEDTQIQSKFSEIPTGEKGSYDSAIEGAYGYTVPYSRSVAGSEDPAKVAEIIQKIINLPDIPVTDYKDFMLITPGKGHLSHYMNALSEVGIPFRIEGKVLFHECEPLISLSHLMSAVADPFDAKASFAAKHLSGCSITDDEIHEYSLRAKEMSPAAVFTMLLEEQRVFARAGTHNAEYVYFALELLRSAEVDGTVSSVEEGAEYIAALVRDESAEERCIQLRRDSNRVHIANLHKVKGLEAPVVILADPASYSRGAESRVDYSVTPPESYIFAFDNSLKTTDYADEKEKEEAVLEAEKLRLLYVAATRAEKILVVSCALKADGDPSSTNPWLPLYDFTDEDIFDSLGPVEIPAAEAKPEFDAEELYEKAESSSVLKNDASKAASYSIRKPSTVTLKGVTSSEDDYEDKAVDEIGREAEAPSRTREQALLIGTMVHRVMEVLVSSGNKADLDKLVLETVREYEADTEAYRDILTKVGNTTRSGGYPQQNGTPQDILGELLNADEVYCELPFCYSDGSGEIWHGVMDVVYRKGDDWHIIDYKTNADADDLDKHYQEQLEAYIKAFKEITGNEADAGTYHIEIKTN